MRHDFVRYRKLMVVDMDGCLWLHFAMLAYDSANCPDTASLILVSEIERCADSFSDLIWDNYCRIVESSPSFCSLEDCSILQALKKHLDEDIFYDIITYRIHCHTSWTFTKNMLQMCTGNVMIF